MAIASDTGRRDAVRPAAGQPARSFITWPALAMMTVGSVGYLGSAGSGREGGSAPLVCVRGVERVERDVLLVWIDRVAHVLLVAAGMRPDARSLG